jgi:type III protein arginine methyltransferase
MQGTMSDSVLAKRAFEPLVAAAKGNSRALLALAEEAFLNGDRARCQELADDALAASPQDPAVQFGVRHLLARMVPKWHFPMMLDDIRNRAYQEAIERAVRPDMKVLDIGSGSGLLAMMAARAGAREVHSCEMNPVIANVAARIVRQNGYDEQVTVHPRNSAKIDPEADLGGQADLVISEIIGKDLVCEHVLPSLRDAVKRLAKPGAQFIPCRGEIRVALAYYPKIEERKVGEICGFDLSEFNQLAPARIQMQVGDPSLVLRGEATNLFSFDFTSLEPHQERVSMDLVATGGAANGVVQWFRLQMDAESSFENSPGPDSSPSWMLVFFPFSSQVELDPGERLTVGASVAKNILRVWQA